MTKTILISDDDPDALEIAKVILEVNGFDVMTAANALEVETIFFEANPDLLLLDLSIPGGGVEIMKRIRRNKKEPEVPILAFTALSGTDEQERLKLQGFDGVVPKPCRPEEIVNIVRKFLKE